VTLAGNPSERPLCCGRTFLAAGLVEEARHEAARFLAAVRPAIERGTPIIGLEPSCLLTLRDEFLSLHPGAEAEALARQSFLIEEFLARESDAGAIDFRTNRVNGPIFVHGHCHQKAFGAVHPILHVLRLIPGTDASLIETGCCGMAGAFGYNRASYTVSVRMAELDLLPALRKMDSQALIVADGFSCRHQIGDLSGRKAQHAIQILRKALRNG
jgi:Fe-S oxidoreductase